jgi:hypothetical protein
MDMQALRTELCGDARPLGGFRHPLPGMQIVRRKNVRWWRKRNEMKKM